jgi:hypothetical protein
MKKLFIVFIMAAAMPMLAMSQTPAAPVAPAAVASAPVAVVSPAPVVPAAPVIAAPPAEKSSYVQFVVDQLEKIPAAGKILSIIFQILSILAVGLTALAACMTAVGAGLAQIGKSIPIFAVASGWINGLLPWVKYLSMYNVQKQDVPPKQA